MHDDVTQFVQDCHTCSHAKLSNQKLLDLLHLLKIPDSTWKEVTVYFKSGLPESKSNDNSIFVIVD
jgi:hypothetical protein